MKKKIIGIMLLMGSINLHAQTNVNTGMVINGTGGNTSGSPYLLLKNSAGDTKFGIQYWNDGLNFYRPGTLNDGDGSLFIDYSTGNIGIGTFNPDTKFHVKDINGSTISGLDTHLEGFTLIDGTDASLFFGAQTGAPLGEWGIEYNPIFGGLNFWRPEGATLGTSGNYKFFIKDDGKISIGLDPSLSSTFNGDYKLYVAEGIMTEKIKVALKNTSNWADYVFDKNYDLKPLEEVESFIKEHKHLPGISSADEIVENGIDLAEMDAKLLENVDTPKIRTVSLDN